jgi:hypothetical protein
MNLCSMLQKFPEEFTLRRVFNLSTRSVEINFCVYKQATSIGVPFEFHRHSARISSFFCLRFALHILKQSYIKAKAL